MKREELNKVNIYKKNLASALDHVDVINNQKNYKKNINLFKNESEIFLSMKLMNKYKLLQK